MVGAPRAVEGTSCLTPLLLMIEKREIVRRSE